MNLEKRKVLQVGKFFYPENGGIETITKLIAEGIQNEWVTDVLCFSKKTTTNIKYDGSTKIIESGHFFTIASTPISIRFFYYFFKLRNKYDIIHVHVPNPLAVLAVLLFNPKGKVVVQWHSDILNQKVFYKIFRFFEKSFLKRADLILGTSPPYITGSKPLNSQIRKVDCLPLAIDEKELSINEKFEEELRNKYPNKKIIFSLGRFVYYKGFEYLIEAASYLQENYVILIGGKGKLLEHYKKIIKKNKLQDRIFLIGSIPQSQLGSYYKACDIFCLPSCEKTEAFGVVLLEAMQFGKPIVACNIPESGVSWVNCNNETGINVAPKNAKELANAIEKVALNVNLEKYGDGAMYRYINHFTKEKMISSLTNFYLRILQA